MASFRLSNDYKHGPTTAKHTASSPHPNILVHLSCVWLSVHIIEVSTVHHMSTTSRWFCECCLDKKIWLYVRKVSLNQCISIYLQRWQHEMNETSHFTSRIIWSGIDFFTNTIPNLEQVYFEHIHQPALGLTHGSPQYTIHHRQSHNHLHKPGNVYCKAIDKTA